MVERRQNDLSSLVEWLRLATQQSIEMNQQEDVELSRGWVDRNANFDQLQHELQVSSQILPILYDFKVYDRYTYTFKNPL